MIYGQYTPLIVACLVAAVTLTGLTTTAIGGEQWQKYSTGHGSGRSQDEACNEASLEIRDFGPDVCVERYRKGLMKDVVASECKCPVQSKGYYHCRIEFVITCETDR